MKRVLFLCTGNYYRSRFAEELFNHLAKHAAVDWQADSCGLDVAKATMNVGPISVFTASALRIRGIELTSPIRPPKFLGAQDLERASQIVALNEREHRPLMQNLFPDWASRIQYWNVDDLDRAEPEEAIPEIEAAVRALLSSLSSPH
jgi:protein-tyrosine phosphatase